MWDISVDYFQSGVIKVVKVCEFASPSLLEPVLNFERSVPLFVCAAPRQRLAPQVQGKAGLSQGHLGM